MDILFNRYSITDTHDYLGQGCIQESFNCYATGVPDRSSLSPNANWKNYLSPKELDDLVDLYIAGNFVWEKPLVSMP